MSITEDLTETVSSAAYDLPATITEFAIDQTLDPGILKDIPVVGWIVKGMSTVQTISDRIFFNKIVRFLFELNKANMRKTEECRAMLRLDKDYGRKVGEHLILVLDKLDSLKKGGLLAKCFASFLAGDINQSVLQVF